MDRGWRSLRRLPARIRSPAAHRNDPASRNRNSNPGPERGRDRSHPPLTGLPGESASTKGVRAGPSRDCGIGIPAHDAGPTAKTATTQKPVAVRLSGTPSFGRAVPTCTRWERQDPQPWANPPVRDPGPGGSSRTRRGGMDVGAFPVFGTLAKHDRILGRPWGEKVPRNGHFQGSLGSGGQNILSRSVDRTSPPTRRRRSHSPARGNAPDNPSPNPPALKWREPEASSRRRGLPHRIPPLRDGANVD